MSASPSNGLIFLVSYNSPRSISTISYIVFLTFALIRFSCAVKGFVEVLPQESEQFFRGPEHQPLAGIYLFHRHTEPASCGSIWGPSRTTNASRMEESSHLSSPYQIG